MKILQRRLMEAKIGQIIIQYGTGGYEEDTIIDALNLALDGIDNIEIVACEGLLADYARERGATAVVKGLRAMSDFEYEFQMALTNKMLNPELETLFFSSAAENMYVSSSMVKSVASFGGNIREFIPECIHDEIRDRLCGGGQTHES